MAPDSMAPIPLNPSPSPSPQGSGDQNATAADQSSPLLWGEGQGEGLLRAHANHQLMLQVWLSPVFPVGAFAYSHGLERAVEAGLITDRMDLTQWITDLLAQLRVEPQTTFGEGDEIVYI